MTHATQAGESGLVHAAIVDDTIDVGKLITLAQSSAIGALSVFLGTVRDVNDGRAVTGIDYEAYRPMAERELAAVARDVCEATPSLRVSIEHRVGTLRVGDVSVAIVAAHPRRAAACDAARQIIEALKVRVPIWKREHYVDGDRAWVDPTGVNASTVHAPITPTGGAH